VKNRWLVTGGAGFIGSNLVRYILESTDASVVVLDKLTYAGHRESLRDVEANARFAFEQGDIADPDRVRAVFATHRPTAVFNLAAETHVDRSIDGPLPFLHTNVAGTVTLLEAARELPDPEFTFLHVSTDEVYGSLGPTGFFTETTAYAPNSPYAASKASADHFVRAYHETYELRTIITNCSNNYGPYQFPEKLVPLTILKAIDGERLPIYGKGTNVRDWLHVEDHCAGLLLALANGEAGQKYNIGARCERTTEQVVDCVCDALDELRPWKAGSYRQLKEFVTDRPAHDFRYAIDNTKMKALGFQARYRDFQRGIRETVQWYLDHRDWCDGVRGTYKQERLGLRARERAK
jgi:dTDP-glucose 4,6-dehydratase